MSPKGEIDLTSELPAQAADNRVGGTSIIGEGTRRCNPAQKVVLLSSSKNRMDLQRIYFLEVVGRSCYRTYYF